MALRAGQAPRPPGRTVKDLVSDLGFEPVDVAERSLSFTAARRVFLDFPDLFTDAYCSARVEYFASSADAEHPCILKVILGPGFPGWVDLLVTLSRDFAVGMIV
jgi:hypothetical protein